MRVGAVLVGLLRGLRGFMRPLLCIREGFALTRSMGAARVGEREKGPGGRALRAALGLSRAFNGKDASHPQWPRDVTGRGGTLPPASAHTLLRAHTRSLTHPHRL